MAAARPTYDHLLVDEAFFALYDRMIGEVDLPAVLRHVAEVVCECLHAERATIYLIETGTAELKSVAVLGNVARVIRVPIDETSLAGFCAATGRAFVVPDAYGDLSAVDPRLGFDRTWDQLNHFRTRDVMCAPAIFREEVLGVVQVVNSRGRVFGEADLAPLRSVSRMVGYALYHARLYDDLASLKQLDRQKAEFMRILVHELKSPVAAAKMLTWTLARQSDDERTAPLVEKITRRMDQMTALIGDILDLARAKTGAPLGQVGVLDLAAETAAGCREYREPAEAKGLQFRVDVPDGPVGVRFDEKGYRLVLSNLVSNAVKYTAAGAVEVRLGREGDRAVLEVADTGMGIPAEDIPKLFGEFFRARNARRSGVPGSGVGLAAVKHLVERFGGEMALDSRENEGTTFTVRLPLHRG